MAKVLVAGAGGAPSEGVIHGLQRSSRDHYVIGVGSSPPDLLLSGADEIHRVPWAAAEGYRESLLQVIRDTRPDLVHFQNDQEIFVASQFRDEIERLGAKTFMPPHGVIDTCVHKHKSYEVFSKAGLPVPRNIELDTIEDLELAFDELRTQDRRVWLRLKSIGGAGAGSLSTDNFDFAKSWIDHHDGWGRFVAAEHLTSRTVTWLSIWHRGDLIVAQTRARIGWVHGNRSVSGVTGVTQVGVTMSDLLVDELAEAAIRSVSVSPHGIFGVDMTYDSQGTPNPTEINISRFFTTVRFFTEAGLNLPGVFADLALGETPNLPTVKINPLPDGLGWFRGMDVQPRLIPLSELPEDYNVG